MRHSKKLLILFTAIAVLWLGGTALADSSIQIPNLTDSTEGKLDNDITAGIYSQFLGPAWTYFFGENAVMGGTGQFSGLFLKICESLNFIALAALVVISIYSFYVFSFEGARKGKAGGQNMNSWVALRTGLSYTGAVPVFHGLSIMQMVLIFMIGQSLIFANFVWKTGAEYIVTNIESPITDSAPPFVDAEAMSAPVPLFQAVLIQELTKARKGNVLNSKIKEHDMPEQSEGGLLDWFSSERYELRIVDGGEWVIEHRPDSGQMILYPMPIRGMSLGGLGGIVVPAPVEPSLNASKAERQIYNAKLKIAQERILAFHEMGEALRPFALDYLQQYGLHGEKRTYGNTENQDALPLINQYRKRVVDVALPLIKSLKESEDSTATKLRKAFGIEQNKEPSGGWIMAGISPALTAIVSNQTDLLNYGGGVTFIVYDDVAPSGGAIGGWLASNTFFGVETIPTLDATERLALTRAPNYAAQVLMRGRAWSGFDANGDPAGNINQLITKAFFGGGWSNKGLWDATITSLSEKNPFAAVIDFGDKLLSFFLMLLAPSVAAGVIGSFPGLGVVNDLINNPAFVAIMIGVLVAGIVFSVVTILFIKDLVIKALAAYFIAVASTLVAAPLWVIAHAFPDGEGLIGRHARKGYVMAFEVLIRPVLIVTGIVLTLILTSCITKVIIQFMTAFVGAYSAFETFSVGTQLLWSVAMVTMVWTTLLYIGRRLIIEFPNSVITVIGGVATSFGAVEQSSNATVNSINGMIGRFGAAVGGLGAGIAHMRGSSLGKNPKDKNDDDKKPQGGDIPQPMAAKTE